MMRPQALRYGLRAAAALAVAVGASCSGAGGGGGGGGGNVTTFRGNLANQTAFLAPRSPAPARRVALLDLLSPVRTAYADIGGVEVCVEGTDSCTTTDANGSFTLPAEVSGVVTLVFTGSDFTARITLPDVPPGATITLADIVCSVATGLCEANDTDVDEPSDVPGEPSEPSDLEPSDPDEPSPSAADDADDVSDEADEDDEDEDEEEKD